MHDARYENPPGAKTGGSGITRRGFLQSATAATGLVLASSASAELLPSMLAGALRAAPSKLSSFVNISTPDKSIEESFWISARLTNRMRQLAREYYGKDGWLAVSDGKTQPQHGYDPRDFRYGPKCAAYLYGDEPTFAYEMGKRIFQDQTDPNDGRILWDPTGQTAIHLAQIAKHFSDYVVYGGQDDLVRQNWNRVTQMSHWALGYYDPKSDGLLENGPLMPNNFWALLVGEAFNFPAVKDCTADVVVVATMEVCEFLGLMSRYASRHNLPEAAWFSARAAQFHEAIEMNAFDTTAQYYYLLRRTVENRWYHSVNGICEDSRELDVTPYYSSIVSGDWSRAVRVAEYARKVLLEYKIFPMPLHYPTYNWVGPNYDNPFSHIPGGAWEEAYYNCVRAWSHCRLPDAVYEAVRRRSEAQVRDQDCSESYSQDGQPHGRDHYGISAAAHVSAIIEGLFGIVPTGFGFDEVDISPNLPIHWAGATPSSIQVALPGSGFLKYTWSCDLKARTIDLHFESDRERKGNLRIFVPGPIASVSWNGQPIRDVEYDSAVYVDHGMFIFLRKPLRNEKLHIEFGRCDSAGLPPASCGILP
jgi:hypothetical protein